MNAGHELAQCAAERLRSAQQVLAETDLEARWSRFGAVTVVGSVALDLVVRPDVDMEVKVSDPKPADGFALMAAVAELPKARRIIYMDDRDRRG